MDDLHRHMIDAIPNLRRYARALKGNADAADDLVQDCLSRAMGRLHLFTPGTNMRAWLFSILHNQHVNNIRRSARQPDRQALESIPESAQSSPGQQEARLELQDIGAALDTLPAEQKQVILLIGLEGMRYAEAAEILGVPIGTVMSRLNRGREQLRHLTSGPNSFGLRRVK
ncbi:MAG: sigma-70 family RNA polymerase sigma factor [Sneathiella sp.]